MSVSISLFSNEILLFNCVIVLLSLSLFTLICFNSILYFFNNSDNSNTGRISPIIKSYINENHSFFLHIIHFH